jgi:hypothetical protein
MDPNGHIYEDLDDRIPAEDKARLQGYLKGRAEADAPHREQAEKELLAEEVERLKAELAKVDVSVEEYERISGEPLASPTTPRSPRTPPWRTWTRSPVRSTWRRSSRSPPTASLGPSRRTGPWRWAMTSPSELPRQSNVLRDLAQQQLARIRELEEALEAVRDTAHDDERARIVDEALRREPSEDK